MNEREAAIEVLKENNGEIPDYYTAEMREFVYRVGKEEEIIS